MISLLPTQVKRTFLLIVVGIILAACGTAPGPDIVLFGQKKPKSTIHVIKKQTLEPVTHKVNKGETLYSISREYGANIQKLVQINKLRPPYKLSPGMELKIPASNIYTVQRGDSVWLIARKFDISTSEIVRINRLARPYTIYVGQKILLPGNGSATALKPKKDIQNTSTRSVENTTTQSPTNRTIVVTENKDIGNSDSREGSNQSVIVPVPKSPKVTGLKTLPPKVVGKTKRGYPRPPAKPYHLRKKQVASVKPIAQPVPRANSKFLMPVRGRVISTYGPKTKGRYNDGVNIAAPRGTSVKAAENGIIAYTGVQQGGFGQLILMRHSDGYISAYAHMGEILVKRGDKVKRGQVIAKVGSSGDVDSPQLHFQIRKGRKTLNPMDFLS